MVCQPPPPRVSGREGLRKKPGPEGMLAELEVANGDTFDVHRLQVPIESTRESQPIAIETGTTE